MGFCSELLSRDKSFDKDTIKYLASKPEMLATLNKLFEEFKTGTIIKIPIMVENIQGQTMNIHLIGINDTSLISSEIEGSVTFTFIKELIEIQRVEPTWQSTKTKLHLVDK